MYKTTKSVEDILFQVSDPEIPVLSVMDMGVIRHIDMDGKRVTITITPTYSGCPAMDTIADDIKKALKNEGFEPEVNLTLSPAWTSDWITERGRRMLEEYGIAAPLGVEEDKRALMGEKNKVKCPQCASLNTKLISPFGSTACKALFQCNECHEPFDYFKCLT